MGEVLQHHTSQTPQLEVQTVDKYQVRVCVCVRERERERERERKKEKSERKREREKFSENHTVHWHSSHRHLTL